MEISTYSKPTDYSPNNDQLFIVQCNYPLSELIQRYTFFNVSDCFAGYAIAVFKVKPKKCN